MGGGVGFFFFLGGGVSFEVIVKFKKNWGRGGGGQVRADVNEELKFS